jgi:hypothetical protein
VSFSSGLEISPLLDAEQVFHFQTQFKKPLHLTGVSQWLERSNFNGGDVLSPHDGQFEIKSENGANGHAKRMQLVKWLC